MSRRQKREQFGYDLRSGRYWVFACFTAEALQKCVEMLGELLHPCGADPRPLKTARWEAGELLPMVDACCTVLVAKTDLPREALWPALRQHFGYENPSPDSDVFTLGISEAQDDLLGAFEAGDLG
jgi:hypothetical protein